MNGERGVQIQEHVSSTHIPTTTPAQHITYTYTETRTVEQVGVLAGHDLGHKPPVAMPHRVHVAGVHPVLLLRLLRVVLVLWVWDWVNTCICTQAIPVVRTVALGCVPLSPTSRIHPYTYNTTHNPTTNTHTHQIQRTHLNQPGEVGIVVYGEAVVVAAGARVPEPPVALRVHRAVRHDGDEVVLGGALCCCVGLRGGVVDQWGAGH
jgi:hypothetical protein